MSGVISSLKFRQIVVSKLIIRPDYPRAYLSGLGVDVARSNYNLNSITSITRGTEPGSRALVIVQGNKTRSRTEDKIYHR